ncbi:MAG: serine kinase [Clostridiales bacterium]|nr:MAG: serine kinase [Clostridiales bacterium]
MKETYIRLNTINDVRKLVSVVEKYPFSVDLSEGRYIVDAKSLMGIFSLDLLQPIKLIAEKDDPQLFEDLKDLIIEGN